MKQKKLVAVVIFGESAVNAYNDEGIKGLRKALEEDGTLVKREFDTEAELKAYYQGIDDMYGWFECEYLDEDVIKAHPRIINSLAM